MKDPSMFYCSEHNGLAITADYEDTVRFTGVSDESIIKFVNGIITHHPELAASFKERTTKAPKAPNAATSKSKKKTVDKPSTERFQTPWERL